MKLIENNPGYYCHDCGPDKLATHVCMCHYTFCADCAEGKEHCSTKGITHLTETFIGMPMELAAKLFA
jgi:hypothetical protein